MSIVEGAEPVLYGEVLSSEPVRGLVTDEKKQIISGINISEKDLMAAKNKSHFGGNALLGSLMNRIKSDDDVIDVEAEPVKR